MPVSAGFQLFQTAKFLLCCSEWSIILLSTVGVQANLLLLTFRPAESWLMSSLGLGWRTNWETFWPEMAARRNKLSSATDTVLTITALLTHRFRFIMHKKNSFMLRINLKMNVSFCRNECCCTCCGSNGTLRGCKSLFHSWGEPLPSHSEPVSYYNPSIHPLANMLSPVEVSGFCSSWSGGILALRIYLMKSIWLKRCAHISCTLTAGSWCSCMNVYFSEQMSDELCGASAASPWSLHILLSQRAVT